MLKRPTENNSLTFSCRMKKDLYGSLLTESEKKGISFNSLINNIAKKHNSWEKFESDIGFIPLSTITLSQLFDILDEKNITNIARYAGETIPKEMAILSHIEDDFEKLVQLVEVISNKFGSVSTLKKINGYSFTIRHKVNKNFSLFISEFFLAMGKSFHISTNIDLAVKNTVILNLEDRLVGFETSSHYLKNR
jgi:hypothetical protein